MLVQLHVLIKLCYLSIMRGRLINYIYIQIKHITRKGSALLLIQRTLKFKQCHFIYASVAWLNSAEMNINTVMALQLL